MTSTGIVNTTKLIDNQNYLLEGEVVESPTGGNPTFQVTINGAAGLDAEVDVLTSNDLKEWNKALTFTFVNEANGASDGKGTQNLWKYYRGAINSISADTFITLTMATGN